MKDFACMRTERVSRNGKRMNIKKLKYTQIENVVLVGTSHIAKESVDNVAAVVNHFHALGPCIVGVELDKQRFYSLVHEQQKTTAFSFSNIRRFGFKGFVFALIAPIAKYIAPTTFWILKKA